MYKRLISGPVNYVEASKEVVEQRQNNIQSFKQGRVRALKRDFKQLVYSCITADSYLLYGLNALVHS